VTVVRFSVSADPDLFDALGDCLLSAGAGALEEAPGALRAYADTPELVLALHAAVAEFRARVDEAGLGLTVDEPEVSEIDGDWNQTWLAHLQPEAVTPTFTARPTHSTDVQAGERTLWLEPSPAFGEGGHASTRLAARAVERAALARPGGRLLDVGTGTGLLALVGVASGFAHALGIDCDAASVQAAARNAELNGVADRFDVSGINLVDVSGEFDLVVANIIVPTLVELAPGLVARLAPEGRLVLSGLLAEDAASLLDRLAELGLSELTRQLEGDWCCLELGRS